MIKTLRVILLLSLMLTSAAGFKVYQSFQTVSISMPEFSVVANNMSEALSVFTEDSQVFIARVVKARSTEVSVSEPIETYGYKFNLKLDSTAGLLAIYKNIRVQMKLEQEHEVNNIPSILVKTNKVKTNPKKIIKPAIISASPAPISNPVVVNKTQTLKKQTITNQLDTDPALQFSDLKKLEFDLLTNHDLTKKIVLAENSDKNSEYYSLKGKPFSKYISKGIPGLRKMNTQKVTTQKPAKEKAPKITNKDTYTAPIIDVSILQQLNTQNAAMKKEDAVAKKENLSEEQMSSKLFEAIKTINKSKQVLNSINANRDEDTLVVDMGQGKVSEPAAVSTQESLFGELRIKNNNQCVDAHTAKAKRKTYKSTLRISADSFILNKGYKNNIKDFNLDFSDSFNDIYYESNGSVVLNQKIANKYAIRRGTIHKSGHYPTVTEYVFEGEDISLNIPLVDIDSMGKILGQYKNIQYDSHALIELDEQTEDVTLVGNGSQYSHKLFLNSNLRVVKPGDSEYVYVLYINVKPGNYFLDYKTTKGIKTSKIVHVETDKVYFDSNYFVKENKDQFAIFENDLLTKCAYEVDVASNQLVSIATQKNSAKLNINNYKFNKQLYPLGTRKYYELKYDKMSLYIGRQDNDKVVIPSVDYVDYVYDQFNIRSLDDMCLIQLNLNKRAENIKVNMTSPNYSYDYDLLVLDEDGLFYKDFTANTNKVFILGSEQGVANIKLDYLDGSKDYIQSYCSDATYLIEEL